MLASCCLTRYNAGMGARVKLPKQGVLCVIDWLDATGHIGEDISAAEPMPCKTAGWLKEIKRDHIIVATSQYTDSYGDFTVIPTGIITAAKECRE